MNKAQKATAAKDIAELTELASYKDVGASALLARSLCWTLGINRDEVDNHLSTDLREHPDFVYFHGG